MGERIPPGDDEPIPNTAEHAERLAATEHVCDVLFDGSAQFETGCVLCEAAVRLGIWERYGYTEDELRGPTAEASDAEEALIEEWDSDD